MVGFGRADIQDSGAAVDGRSKIKDYFDILLNGYYGWQLRNWFLYNEQLCNDWYIPGLYDEQWHNRHLYDERLYNEWYNQFLYDEHWCNCCLL